MKKNKLFFEKRLLSREVPKGPEVEGEKPEGITDFAKDVKEKSMTAAEKILSLENKVANSVAESAGLTIRKNENPGERAYVFSADGKSQFVLQFNKKNAKYEVYAPDKDGKWNTVEASISDTMAGAAAHLDKMPIKLEREMIDKVATKHSATVRTNNNSLYRGYILSVQGISKINLQYNYDKKKYMMYVPTKDLATKRPKDWQYVINAEADSMDELATKYAGTIDKYLSA